MLNIGDYPVNATVRIPWNTCGQDGASITRSTNGTLTIYKDGGTTQRASANGVTDTEDFDSNTGMHIAVIDLSDNSDAGFYAAGHYYDVSIVGAVIDTKTVNAWIGRFSIEMFPPYTAIPGSPTANSINERVKAIDDKLPSKSYLTGSSNSDGDVQMDEATGNFAGTVGKSSMSLAAGDVSGNLPADLKAITAGVDLSATMKASVNAEVDTALVDINLDHLIKVAKDTDWATTVTKESVIDLMTSKDTSQTFARATDSHEGIRDATLNAAVVSMGNNTLTAAALATDAANEISNNLLDQVNNAAAHNVANSVGRQIRQGGGGAISTIYSGTAQAGSTSNTIKLAAGASATNNIYNGATIVLTGGVGVGQTRRIVAYNGTTKFATVDKTWIVTPTNTTTFDIIAGNTSIVAFEGVAAGGGNDYVDLPSAAVATDGYYSGFVVIESGTGAGQSAEITGYTGVSRRVSIAPANWVLNPSTDSVVAIMPQGDVVADATTPPTVTEIAAAILRVPANTLLTDTDGRVEVNASNITAIQSGLALEVTLGTPADTDLATDIANLATQVSGLPTPGDATLANQNTIIGLIGTPTDTDISTDIANVATQISGLPVPPTPPAKEDIAAEVLLEMNATPPLVQVDAYSANMDPATQVLENPAWPIETDNAGYVTANVTGSVVVSGEVVLDANQPHYAPAKVSDLGVVQTGDSYAVVTNVTYGLSAIKSLIDTITNRVGAFTGSGINTILGFFKAVMAKAAGNPSDLGALTFNAATDSLEAMKDTGIPVTVGDVTLAALQPNYAPAKAGDAMTLTPAYNAAKTAAQASALTTVDTVVDAIKLKTDNLPSDPADQSLLMAELATKATLANQVTIVNAISNLDGDVANLDADLVNVHADIAALGSPMQAGSSVTVSDKTGFKLASDGLDVVAAPADLANDTAARANFVGMFRALFNRFYDKVTQTSGYQRIFNDADVQVSIAPVSDNGVVQTKGKSS